MASSLRDCVSIFLLEPCVKVIDTVLKSLDNIIKTKC